MSNDFLGGRNMAECKNPGCHRAALRDGNGWCFWCDPSLESEQFEARSKGGKASRKVLNPEAIEDLNLALLKDVDELVSRALKATVTGDLTVSVSKATGYLARSLTMIRETALLEARIAAIEEKIEKMGGMR